MAEPPPPELLEQLGIEPHCTCEGHVEQHAIYRARVPANRDQSLTPRYLSNPTSVNENLMRDIATATLSGNLTAT